LERAFGIKFAVDRQWALMGLLLAVAAFNGGVFVPWQPRTTFVDPSRNRALGVGMKEISIGEFARQSRLSPKDFAATTSSAF
jgi:hypothetical protein